MAAVRDDEYAAVVERERPLLQACAYLLTGDAGRADRLVQLVLARMYERWDRRHAVRGSRRSARWSDLAARPARCPGTPAATVRAGRRRSAAAEPVPSRSWPTCGAAAGPAGGDHPGAVCRAAQRADRRGAGPHRSTRYWCWPGRPGRDCWPRPPGPGRTTPRWPRSSARPCRSTGGPRTALPTTSSTAASWYAGAGSGAAWPRRWPWCCSSSASWCWCRTAPGPASPAPPPTAAPTSDRAAPAATRRPTWSAGARSCGSGGPRWPRWCSPYLDPQGRVLLRLRLPLRRSLRRTPDSGPGSGGALAFEMFRLDDGATEVYVQIATSRRTAVRCGETTGRTCHGQTFLDGDPST